MGMRFRKSVKICKGVKVNFSKSGTSLSVGGRGHSVNFSKRGARATVGIPGTGLSYTSTIGGGSTSRSSSSSVSMPSSVGVQMNDKAQITILDENGSEITDPAVLRKIKSTSQFKAMKEQLELQRREKIEEILKNDEEKHEQYLNIYKESAYVDSYEQFVRYFNYMKPNEYIVEDFAVAPPVEAEIRNILEEEAKENVKALFFKTSKLRQYVEERLPLRLAEKVSEWERDRSRHYQEQHEIKKVKDAEFIEQYKSKKAFLELLIQGDEAAVCEAFDNWIASCELPVEMNVDYDYNKDEGILMLDVDLPEIEDLPSTKMTKTSAGNLKEKKKTQAELRGEYATLVFGLAIFVASNAFNTAPVIKKILISGYTQRRDREGSLNDDYIYSLKFTRDKFENIIFSTIAPMEFCMSFENRCNMTSTSLFRKIKPFDEF